MPDPAPLIPARNPTGKMEAIGTARPPELSFGGRAGRAAGQRLPRKRYWLTVVIQPIGIAERFADFDAPVGLGVSAVLVLMFVAVADASGPNRPAMLTPLRYPARSLRGW